MGLLDDAIREHLELKRRHGADPQELSRQEQEALGEGRRAEFARPAGEADEAPEAEAPAAVPEFDEPPELSAPGRPPEPITEPPAPAPPEPAPPQPEPEPAPDPAPEPPPSPEAAGPFDVEAEAAPREEQWLDDEPDEVPADESLDRRPEPEDEPEPEVRRDPEGQEEDVLEETPDFLQETPEHDRLWFEQRPPRDFDWDK